MGLLPQVGLLFAVSPWPSPPVAAATLVACLLLLVLSFGRDAMRPATRPSRSADHQAP